jgi:hypothetical protein
MKTGDPDVTPSQLTMGLFAVFATGIVVAIGLFIAVSAGVFAHYDFGAGTKVGGPPLTIALIPLGLAVLAGATSAVTWTIEKKR